MTSTASTTSLTAGTSVWQELTVATTDGLAEFYQRILGWELVVDGDTGLFTLDGIPVAGLRVNPSAEPAATGWLVYLGADDVDAAVARAVAAGASIVDSKAAVPTQAGIAAILRDPEGPLFGIAAVDAVNVSAPSAEIGRMALVDIMSHDLAAATEFQAALFPLNSLVHVEDELSIFRDEQARPLRGVNAIHDEAKAFLPPHWLAWFVVADQAEAAAAAIAAGGGVNVQDQPIAFGRWAVLTDPSGAAFKALELDRPI